jgi:hypothetical protein
MTTAPRVTAADLELAALWLDNYEAQDDDPSGEGMRRVAAWLRQHADRRRVDAFVRSTGHAPTAAARTAAAAVMARTGLTIDDLSR